MRALGFKLVTMILALFALGSPAYAQDELNDPPPHLRMTLLADSDIPKAGGVINLAIDTRPQPGWHGYWQNTGDAGFPTKFSWTLPKGLTASEPAYPAPQRLIVAGLMNYVFEKPYAPIVRLTIPAGLAAGTKLPIKLKLQYLVCTANLCVPESAELATELTVGDGAPNTERAPKFAGWLAALPKPLGAQAAYQVQGGALRISVPYPASAKGADAYFYPLTANAIDYAAPQSVSRDGDRLVIATKGNAQGSIEGVLSVDSHALAVKAVPGVVPAVAAKARDGGWSTALIAFLGAVLGGLILNVMPCVFPILSLKALSLARAGGDERGARHEALAYTAGAIAVCLALGGAILALRAGGSAVGWAFQLQNPQVLMVLLLLTVGISLNLAGSFELPTPQFVNKTGSWSGAFVTGALAAFVATPCTGPFMGAALGAALVLPWLAALAVFGGLGLGLALPFLLLGFVPALRKRLPKPGAWMDTLRRFLSIPMWLTAVALAWVLGKQAGIDGMALALLVTLGFAIVLWTAGRRQARGLGFGAVAIALLLVATVAGVWLIRAQPAQAVAAAGVEPFSEAKLAQLRASGRPVFAYFTADWCLTCKVNERLAIDPALPALKVKNVAVLVGDWTNGDATLGKFIEAHNRAGVPLYLYYPAGGAEPQVLPQILTSSMLENLK